MKNVGKMILVVILSVTLIISLPELISSSFEETSKEYVDISTVAKDYVLDGTLDNMKFYNENIVWVFYDEGKTFTLCNCMLGEVVINENVTLVIEGEVVIDKISLYGNLEVEPGEKLITNSYVHNCETSKITLLNGARWFAKHSLNINSQKMVIEDLAELIIGDDALDYDEIKVLDVNSRNLEKRFSGNGSVRLLENARSACAKIPWKIKIPDNKKVNIDMFFWIQREGEVITLYDGHSTVQIRGKLDWYSDSFHHLAFEYDK